jgi:uncharacterized protein YjiS (DUF1127 family)
MTAIHLHAYRPSAGALRRGAALDALNDTAQWALATIGEWHRRRRDREQLARLDDRMLLDIGLNRADAEFLINKPFWRE